MLRFNGPGPVVSSSDGLRLLKLLGKIPLKRGDWIVFSGSLPPGLQPDFYKDAVGFVRRRYPGVFVALDADGDALNYGIAGVPTLVKPNAWELRRISGEHLSSPGKMEKAARKIISTGVEFVLVTLGENGAIGFSSVESVRVAVPRIRAKGAVGCGDAFLGGFLHMFAMGRSFSRCLQFAAAAGTAKAEVVGTLMPSMAAVRKNLRTVKIIPFCRDCAL